MTEIMYDRKALRGYLEAAVKTRTRKVFTCDTEQEAQRLRWALYRAKGTYGITGVAISLTSTEVRIVPYIDPGA